MPIKRIELDGIHPANPLTEVISGVNENLDAIVEAFKNVNGGVGVVGETGAKGDKGDIGPAGIQGPQGERGEQGLPGKDGVNGIDGKNGLDGRDGKDGPAGNPGPQGPQGVQGPVGPAGKDGVQGPPGNSGKDGIQGLPGKDGKDGAVGAQGPKGDIGPQGPAGKDGGTAGFAIANTATTAGWINLGTWTTVNQGTTLYLRIVAHAGFNADTNQSQVTELYFKTSNAISNVGGFYADGSATRNPALGSCNVAPSVIRVVQNSQTSYTFYGYFGTWTDGSHYTYSTDSKSSWTHNGALSAQPSGTTLDITPVASGTKTAAGYVNAGTFVTLDNIRASVTTSSNRGLSVATVAGTATYSISGTYGLAGGGNGWATNYPGANYTTTPSTSWFGWNFANAGDGSTYLVNDYTNKKFYRIHLMIGPGYNDNFISIERISDGIIAPPPPVAPVAVGVAAPAPKV